MENSLTGEWPNVVRLFHTHLPLHSADVVQSLPCKSLVWSIYKYFYHMAQSVSLYTAGV